VSKIARQPAKWRRRIQDIALSRQFFAGKMRFPIEEG
jgi:hypothetical protein